MVAASDSAAVAVGFCGGAVARVCDPDGYEYSSNYGYQYVSNRGATHAARLPCFVEVVVVTTVFHDHGPWV